MRQPGSRLTQGDWYGRPATKRSNPAAGQALDDDAWRIVSSLIAGIAIYGGLGWLISVWLGHRALLVALGSLIGLSLAMYLVHKRLGQPDRPPLQGTDRT